MPVIPKNCTQQDVVYNGQYGVVTDSNGLYYMRARYYNVDIKRFINQDVVEGSITNSPSLNKYAYCQGNPVSLLDPFGLSPQSAGSFAGHLILDILGFIPVIGFFADVINGAWYLAEGNYFCAAMSFIAAIPMFGDAVGLTAEGTKYACVFNKIVFGTRALANLATFGRSLSQISEISADLTQKHIVEGKKWDSESTLEVITGLGYIAEAIFSAYDFGNSVNGFASSQCFVAGTLVLTSEGSKAIEEIKAGDLVYSTNPETGESEYKEVARVFRRESDIIIHVFVNGEEIETTPNHPFWVENQWVLAKDLREGDVLTLADGTTATITRTYGEQLDEPVIVYNFEVQDFHTYYVTNTGVLVHNYTCGSSDVYIPKDEDGNPIPLEKQRVQGEDIPLPDPAAEGRPHTVLGGKISSETGEVYRQSATFQGSWPLANGQEVPLSEVHWSNHGRGDHMDPHQHIFTWNPVQKKWERGSPTFFFQGSYK